MSVEEELLRHGFSRGSTATEHTLRMLEYIGEGVRRGEDVARVLRDAYERFVKTRPTSAQAYNVLRDIVARYREGGDVAEAVEAWRGRVVEECREAGLVASKRLVDGDVVLTMSRSRCVLEAVKAAAERGVRDLVFYVTESRPGLEGLVMAEELAGLGYRVKLIVDSAARFFMEDVDKVFVGAEAVAMNGAVVGKVGTSLVALVAHEARVRVFTVAPSSKISLATITGELVEIPEGDWRRLMSPDVLADLPEGYNARVPLYDAAPPQYIDGIATEKGLIAPQGIPVIIRELYGTLPPRLPRLEDMLGMVKGR